MPRRFASVLDECLAALSRGDSLDDCVARYPDHADELRVQLLLAGRLSASPRHEPRPGVQAAAWQRFRLRVEDMRLGRKPRVSINVGWLRPLAIAAALLIAVVGAGGGTIYASQDALPDSPLYRVKLASEDVRVWFTFGDSAKADLLLNQSNERREEIMEMLRSGKPISGNVLDALRQRNARAVRVLEDHPDELALLTRAREQAAAHEGLLLALWGDLAESAQDDYAEAVATMHNAQLRTSGIPGSVSPGDVAAGVINISGAVQPLLDGILIGGVEVALDARTLGETALAAGQSVRVVAARGADGRLLALVVRTTDGQQPDQSYIVSGALEEVGEGEVTIAGQRIAITERTLLKLRLRLGQQVEVTVDDIGGQAVAASVEGPPDDGGEGAPLLAYEGVIEAQVSTASVTNDWVVGGQEFTVTPSTEIDARAGALTQGTRARVEAVAEDGAVIAKRVVVLSDGGDADVVRVEGVLERGDAATWTVSGVEVEAPPDVDTPAAGSLIALEGRREGDRLVAGKIFTTFTPGPGGLALLRGPVGRIDDGGSWQVGLVPVQIGDESVVSGKAKVGSRVFIWVSPDEQGVLKAIYVNVLDGSSDGGND
jgi:hypothetical protein